MNMQITHSKTSHALGTVAAALLAIASLAAGPVHASTTPAVIADNGENEDHNAIGIVSVRPDGTNIGDWIIGDATYTADGDTEIDDSEGPLDVGSCVDVKYTVQGDINTATQISESYSCQNGGGEQFHAKGIIDSTPREDTGSDFGDWVVGGITYVATSGVTVIDESEGALNSGACADVKYIVDAVAVANNAVRIKATDGCEDNGGGNNGGGNNGGGNGSEDGGYSNHHADHFKGIVVAFPTELAGEWIISTTTNATEAFTATADTDFEQSSGPFQIGQCVKVETAGIGSQFAASIYTDDGCDGAPAAQLARFTGFLNALPDDPELLGTWTVATTTFEVVTDTEQIDAHGPFIVGACVRLAYDLTNPSNPVSRVRTASLEDCGPIATPISGTITATFGIVDDRPLDTVFGTWTISGTTYEAITGTTRFKLEHGMLNVDDCVHVKYAADEVTGLLTAVRIESEEDFRCTPPTEIEDTHGVVTMIPDGSYGVWEIGGHSYTAISGTTKILGDLQIDSIAEVRFTVQTDGTLLAQRIKLERVFDHDRNGGKSYGLIETRPTSPTIEGEWTIAGATYTAISTTRTSGALNIGDCGEVFFSIDDAGANIARRIKPASSEHCVIDPISGLPVQRAYGFVTDAPASGYIGTWSVGGSSYEADASTLFSDTNGALTTGAFVEVRYTISDNVRSALQIETELPPNGGNESRYGKLRVVKNPDGSESYFLNGDPIELVDATLLDETQGAIEDGANVYVNSEATPLPHTAARSTVAMKRTVTRIQTMTSIPRAYAPMMQK